MKAYTTILIISAMATLAIAAPRTTCSPGQIYSDGQCEECWEDGYCPDGENFYHCPEGTKTPNGGAASASECTELYCRTMREPACVAAVSECTWCAPSHGETFGHCSDHSDCAPMCPDGKHFCELEGGGGCPFDSETACESLGEVCGDDVDEACEAAIAAYCASAPQDSGCCTEGQIRCPETYRCADTLESCVSLCIDPSTPCGPESACDGKYFCSYDDDDKEEEAKRKREEGETSGACCRDTLLGPCDCYDNYHCPMGSYDCGNGYCSMSPTTCGTTAFYPDSLVDCTTLTMEGDCGKYWRCHWCSGSSTCQESYDCPGETGGGGGPSDCSPCVAACTVETHSDGSFTCTINPDYNPGPPEYKRAPKHTARRWK
eukprot:TRINITY_DN33188_c0_g1_i1.p1 TRINITY_DN33188_c0_g1~~TRINITY_DN33188_c0_g1_i1.p1  ORF type:complete len:375 (-),score=49.72 TRINITY_DN33188_c0_g1_i1:118-1242(-)